MNKTSTKKDKKVKKIESMIESRVESKSIKKIDIKTLSDEEIQGLFEEAFFNQVGSYNGINEVEAKCSRELGKSSIKIEVLIQGLAGTPTAEDFRNGKVKNAETITISREDKGSLSFKILPKETVYLNSTEYAIVYQTIS
jgi:hypothetical protein